MTKLLLSLLLLFQLKIYPQEENLQKEISSILNKLPSSTNTSIFIYNPNSRDTLIQQKISRSMIPASNTKLFTTAAALNLMGSSFELKTSILTEDIDLSDGTIDGNLYIKGLGNPLFKNSDLDSLVEEISKLGIKKITGKVIGDDSYFDNIYYRDDWITGERTNVSVPPVSAMVIDRNKMLMRLDANKKVGNKLGYTLTPKNRFNTVTMNAKVTGKRARPKFSSRFLKDGIKINVKGGLKKRRRPALYAIYIDKPALYAAFLLHSKLTDKGVTIAGMPAEGITPIASTEINYSSVELAELIKPINKNSDNFLAEVLFKSIGAFNSEDQGNSFYATQAVLTYIEEKSIFDEGTAVVDGSGISRFNEITTGAIIGLLEEIYFDDSIFMDFYNSLSISGVDGTLEDRFIATPLAKNFRGKTGTLRGVTALSGYFTTESGEDLIVSIIMEFKSKGARFHKNIQEELLLLLYKRI